MKRRTIDESIENLKRVVENENDNVDVVGEMNIVMADAYSASEKATEHIDEVKEDLEKKAEEVITDNPDEGKQPENEYTAKLVLDEALDDFDVTQPVKDGRANKVYEDDDEDDYLDYDMFDFIYGLVTDCWPKPLNPLGGKLRKFQRVSQDKYKNANPESEEQITPQVATSGNGKYIELYADPQYVKGEDGKTTEVLTAFDQIKEICELYKFKYSGPNPRRNSQSRWKYVFSIEVPQAGTMYPMMVEEYFNDIGYTLEDVMPADFCKQYRKRLNRINKEVEKRINDRDVEKLVNRAITDAAKDSTLPLKDHLDKLYNILDSRGLTYMKSKIKKTFMDAFDDPED